MNRLDDAARSQLRQVRKDARDRLTPASVDAHEPRLALPRAAYREHVVREAVESLTGPARDYVDAFAAADGLIETAASAVFGQIACYPLRTMAAADLEVVPGLRTTVRYTAPDFADFPQPGDVVWLDDPLVTDAVRINGVTMSFDAAAGGTLALTAEVLVGTAEAWAA
jgi:hypothetical protein